MTTENDEIANRAKAVRYLDPTLSFAAAVELVVDERAARQRLAAEPADSEHRAGLDLFAKAKALQLRNPKLPIIQAATMVQEEERAWEAVSFATSPYDRQQRLHYARVLSHRTADPTLSFAAAFDASMSAIDEAVPVEPLNRYSFAAVAAADTGEAKPFDLFRTGTFRSMEGRAVHIGRELLEGIAARYNKQRHPAPFVIGHPASADAPAHGWVKRLTVVGDRLVCFGEKISQSFAAMVKAGTYPRVSAQFFSERDPANPTPGHLHLRHVGFLGGAAPGVTGLETVSFD